jgi:hypothetical protein
MNAKNCKLNEYTYNARENKCTNLYHNKTIKCNVKEITLTSTKYPANKLWMTPEIS